MPIKEEIEAGAAGIHGKRLKEYTQRYEFLKDGIVAAEQIQRNEPCTDERIGKVIAAKLVINDLSPSEDKKKVDEIFEKALDKCNQKNECLICKVFNK